MLHVLIEIMIETWIRVGISARGILNEITIELKK